MTSCSRVKTTSEESHWGSEDQTRDSAYEVALEKTIHFQDRTSTLFEGFISPLAVGGDTPEEIARVVALRTERGTRPHLAPEKWDDGFRTQTGQNANVAANGIAKCCG